MDSFDRGVPASPAATRAPRGLRVTGPGRLERSYQRRIESLRGEVERRSKAVAHMARQLEIAGIVERGTGRLADRVERDLDVARQRASRLLVALGALQKENEGLRGELAQAQTRLARLEAPRPAPWWRRLLGGA